MKLKTSLAVLMMVLASLAPAKPAGGKVAPENAWKMLREGNERFARGLAVHPHTSKERREELRGGQAPFATVLSCSDSRIPSERILDQGFGDIFTVRVAGNYSAGEMVVGSVEYAVLHLGTRLVLVLGHESCGAVKAAVGRVKDPGTSVEALVKHLIPAADEAKDAVGKRGKDEVIDEAIERNVLHSMASLLKNAPKVAKEVKSGRAMVIGGVYSLASNRVHWIGPHPDQDSILATADEKAKARP